MFSVILDHVMGKTNQVMFNFQIYIDDLENKLRLVRYFSNYESAFQGDNVPVHRARITENYKQENNINCTPWPSVSGPKCV